MYTRRHHIVTGILYLVVSVFLIRQPLFGNFGFEFSVAIALAASLIAGFAAIRDERRTSEIPPPVRLRNGLWFQMVYLIIPLIVVFAAAIPRLPCDPVEGLTFYALLPLVTVIVAYIAGWLVSLLFGWARVTYVLLLIVSVAVSGLTTFFQPKIFFYNPFIGFFPGLSYDQLLPVTKTLIMYRGYSLFLALLALLFIYMLRFQPVREYRLRERLRQFRHIFANSYVSIFITIGFILIFVQFLSRGSLGFSTPRSYLENQLGSVFETSSFSIHYSSDSFDEETIRWVALEHEFRRNQAMKRLGVMHVPGIRSYLYPSPEMKRRLIGPGTTNIAKPWSREVHINAGDYDRSLLHELAHVVAGEFGMPVLRIADSPAMIEGTAMAVEGVWGNRTLHEHAAAILQFGIVDDPRPLLTAKSFAMQHSAVSYVMTGSFVQYLIDRYGIHRVRNAYAWSDYEKAFDRPGGQLIREWMNFLDRINVSERQRLKTMIHFKRPSIFFIRCPRALARINRDARELMDEKRYAEAAEYFERSWEITPNATALGGMIRCAYRLEQYESVLGYAQDDELLEEFPQVIPIVYRAAGDIYALRGDFENAGYYYRRLLSIDFNDSLNESLYLRLLALENPEDEGLWKLLFAREESDDEDSDPYRDLRYEEIDSPGMRWMLARHLHRSGNFEHTGTYFATLRDEFEEPFLRYLAAMRIGQSLYYSGSFQEAVLEFWDAMNYVDSPAAIHRINEWIDRSVFADEFGRSILEPVYGE
jgi:tetratricopeptide (TPR) repeat protein